MKGVVTIDGKEMKSPVAQVTNGEMQGQMRLSGRKAHAAELVKYANHIVKFIMPTFVRDAGAKEFMLRASTAEAESALMSTPWARETADLAGYETQEGKARMAAWDNVIQLTGAQTGMAVTAGTARLVDEQVSARNLKRLRAELAEREKKILATEAELKLERRELSIERSATRVANEANNQHTQNGGSREGNSGSHGEAAGKPRDVDEVVALQRQVDDLREVLGITNDAQAEAEKRCQEATRRQK